MKRTSGKQHSHPSAEEENKQKAEALSLSPERIEDGATTTTQVLNEILEREETNYYSRHWGINE
jgi:hypothetical protein